MDALGVLNPGGGGPADDRWLVTDEPFIVDIAAGWLTLLALEEVFPSRGLELFAAFDGFPLETGPRLGQAPATDANPGGGALFAFAGTVVEERAGKGSSASRCARAVVFGADVAAATDVWRLSPFADRAGKLSCRRVAGWALAVREDQLLSVDAAVVAGISALVAAPLSDIAMAVWSSSSSVFLNEMKESLREISVCVRGETNRSNIRIKVFVHRCSNFVSLFELFVPLAHAQNNLRSKKSQFWHWTSYLLVRHLCGSTSKRTKGRVLLRHSTCKLC